MIYRILAAAAALIVVALALLHPAARPAAALAVEQTATAPPHRGHPRRPEAAATTGVVYVVGAVKHPGLYHIAMLARADDAVRSAGGLRADADPAGVNLAAFAHDGDEIVVPVLGQSIARAVKRRPRTPRKRKAAAADGVAVDVNAADATALAQVPGIGKAIAERIVAVRERDGAYDSFDQLLDVAGMTQSRLDRAQPYLRI
ncbi:MAG TPA: helix-hairpin-helix domain-containing protein [Candidatus Baltobacteraceae bacterium]|nr:helix-hairpin-helix domain-containing protein [Candidatus Baltobacteraceae bacterium]